MKILKERAGKQFPLDSAVAASGTEQGDVLDKLWDGYQIPKTDLKLLYRVLLLICFPGCL